MSQQIAPITQVATGEVMAQPAVPAVTTPAVYGMAGAYASGRAIERRRKRRRDEDMRIVAAILALEKNRRAHKRA